MRKRIINALCPYPLLPVRHAVLINSFPNSEGIRLRPKRNQTTEFWYKWNRDPWRCPRSWWGYWHRLPAMDRYIQQHHITAQWLETRLSSHLAYPWYADQLPYQHSLFTSHVFVSGHPGGVNRATWGGGKVQSGDSEGCQPSVTTVSMYCIFPLQDLLLAPESKWVVL